MTVARMKAVVVVATAGVLGTLVILHTPHLNGPWYWQWPWVRLDAPRLFPAMLLAAAPLFLAEWIHGRDRSRDAIAVPLLMLSTLCLELTAAGQHRRVFNLDSVAEAVRDPIATSYFSDARDLAAQGVSFHELMSAHSKRMPRLRVHTRFKPPGLLLYHMAFIKVFGATRIAALAAGLVIALLATASVGATYLLILRLCADADAAFCGAAYLSLCPSLVLFLPQFDQIYPAVACALLGLWAAALARDRGAFAVGFGLVLALACFFSQMFLVLGIFLAGLTLPHVRKPGSGGLLRVARHALLALVACVSVYLLLWLATGYDPVSTYRVASRLLAGYSVRAERPYPIHVLFDLLDFSLGSGWISVPLVAFFLVGRARWPGYARFVALLALAQILLTAALGIVPAETARTWMLMLPLLMMPIGLELAGWTPRMRLVAYGALWFVLVAVAQNMGFVIKSRI